MVKELERDVFKLLGLGVTAVIVIKLVEVSGGIGGISKAFFGGYTDTLHTIGKT